MTDTSWYRRCPCCGGEFPGDRTGSCPHCSVPLAPDGPIKKIMIRNEIDRALVMDAIEGLLFYKYVLKALNIKFIFTECRLEYVPFWKLKAFVTGHVDGYVDEGGETPTIVPATRHVYKTLTWTGIADDTANIGVKYLRNMEGEVVPYDTPAVQELRITVSPDEAVAKGSYLMEYYGKRQLWSEGLERASYSEINIRPLEMDLVIYPLWTVKYTCSRLVFRATVDGVTGELLAGGRIYGLIARGIVAGLLGAMFILLIDISYLVNYYIGYVLLILMVVIGHGVIVDMLTFIRYGERIAGDRIEYLLTNSPKMNCKKSLIARIGVAIGCILMVLSIFVLMDNEYFFYYILSLGLAIYLLSSFMVCNLSDMVIGELRDDL